MDSLARARRTLEIIEQHGLLNHDEIRVELGKRQRISE
jgi:hypothetical protein